MPPEISDGVLQHFKKVRNDTGISISLQMKMLENGYKIVEINDE